MDEARPHWCRGPYSPGFGVAACAEGLPLLVQLPACDVACGRSSTAFHSTSPSPPSPCSAQQALEEYRQLIQQHAPQPAEPDHAADADTLLRGAVLIARHRYPLLRHDDVAEQLDDLAVQARRLLLHCRALVACCSLHGCAGGSVNLLPCCSGRRRWRPGGFEGGRAVELGTSRMLLRLWVGSWVAWKCGLAQQVFPFLTPQLC